MDIPDYLLKDILRHSKNVITGFNNPNHKTLDNIRLLKKDIYKLERLLGKEVITPK